MVFARGKDSDSRLASLWWKIKLGVQSKKRQLVLLVATDWTVNLEWTELLLCSMITSCLSKRVLSLDCIDLIFLLKFIQTYISKR